MQKHYQNQKKADESSDDDDFWDSDEDEGSEAKKDVEMKNEEAKDPIDDGFEVVTKKDRKRGGK